jgi:HK97 family phage prohead protease
MITSFQLFMENHLPARLADIPPSLEELRERAEQAKSYARALGYGRHFDRPAVAGRREDARSPTVADRLQSMSRESKEELSGWLDAAAAGRVRVGHLAAKISVATRAELEATLAAAGRDAACPPEYRASRDSNYAGSLARSRTRKGGEMMAGGRVLELKSDGGGNECVVYGCIFENVDRGGDVIERGAVANLDEFVKSGHLLVGHKQDALPVGYPTSARQDNRGLLVTCNFHDTPEAVACQNVIRRRLSAGKDAGASIGYVANEYHYEQRGGQTVRVLESIDVWEISFVNIAMNQLAGFVSA